MGNLEEVEEEDIDPNMPDLLEWNEKTRLTVTRIVIMRRMKRRKEVRVVGNPRMWGATLVATEAYHQHATMTCSSWLLTS